MNKLCSIDQALGLFKYCDIVNITASGGGSMDADLIYKGIEKKLLETGEPNNLVLIQVAGIGSGNETGIDWFVHKGPAKELSAATGSGPGK